MLSLFRICRNVYNPVDPTGAMITSGRWHIAGQKVLYFSSSLSLCILELNANGVSFNTIRQNYHYTSIELEYKESLVDEIPESLYKKNWKFNSKLTRKTGTEWYNSRSSLLLKVKSAALPVEYNYVINTLHPYFSEINFIHPESIPLDSRIK